MFSPLTYIYATRIGAGAVAILLAVAALGITNEFYYLKLAIMGIFGALAIFFFLLRCPQISVASIVASVLFNPLVPIYLPRHIWVILDIVALVGILYATYWATNPYKKGIRFEQYVANLFPDSEYAIEDRTRDISKFSNRFVESDGHPDFVFRNKQTNVRFAVECKWRGKWAQNKAGQLGIWWKPWQAERYAEFGKQLGMPVFVAFGIGGTPQKPQEVYFLEAERLHYVFLNQTLIRSGKTALETS